jgi:hypothetical protein
MGRRYLDLVQSVKGAPRPPLTGEHNDVPPVAHAESVPLPREHGIGERTLQVPTVRPGTPIEATDLPPIPGLGGLGIQPVWVALRAVGSLLNGYHTDQDGPPLPPAHLPAIALREHRCWACRGTRFWCPPSLSRWICARCHPPAVEPLVMLTLEVAGAQLQDTGARPQFTLRPSLARRQGQVHQGLRGHATENGGALMCDAVEGRTRWTRR